MITTVNSMTSDVDFEEAEVTCCNLIAVMPLAGGQGHPEFGSSVN